MTVLRCTTDFRVSLGPQVGNGSPSPFMCTHLLCTLQRWEVFMPTLQVKQLRLSKIQSLAQHHPVPEWLNWDPETDSKAHSPSQLSYCLRVQWLPWAGEETDAQRGEVSCSRSLWVRWQESKTETRFIPGFHTTQQWIRLPWAEGSFPSIGYSLSSLKSAGVIWSWNRPRATLLGQSWAYNRKQCFANKYLLVGTLSLCTSLLLQELKVTLAQIKSKTLAYCTSLHTQWALT